MNQYEQCVPYALIFLSYRVNPFRAPKSLRALNIQVILSPKRVSSCRGVRLDDDFIFFFLGEELTLDQFLVRVEC